MDLTEMMDKLVIDLKMTLSTEISIPEATRCIEKAVDALSRKIPRERIYEHTWIEDVTDETFVTPSALSATAIVNAADISASVDGATLTLVTSWLDKPRLVTLTLTDAANSITRMTVIVKGTDQDGVYREERFYRHNGKTQTGKVYFYSIYEVEINEISGNGAADTLSIGTSTPFGIWVQLANPIKPDSELVYSGALKTGTKYTLDTDYRMDYANGRILMLSTGAMAASTTYYITYKKSQVSVDISEIIPELIRIVTVKYPVDKIPEQSVGFNIWENMLTIASPRQGVSQEALQDGEHVAIYYEARHAPPTLVGSGSYPALLDEVILMGAGGYALEIEALQHELQAVTDIANLRTTLGSVDAVHTLAAAALAKAAVLNTATTGKVEVALARAAALLTDTTGKIDIAIARASALLIADTGKIDIALARAGTLFTATTGKVDVALIRAGVLNTATTGKVDIALARASVLLTATTGKIDLALTKVALYLETNGTTDNAKDVLSNITDDIASLRTAIDAAQDAAATALGLVATTSIDAVTVGAEGYLSTGDDLINVLNTGGGSVPERYADYSRSRVAIANARIQQAASYVQEAQSRVNNLLSYISEADSWMHMGEVFVQEASALIAQVNGCIGEANGYLGLAGSNIAEASAYLGLADGSINEARTYVEKVNQCINESGAYNNSANTSINEANTYINLINGCISEANAHISRIDRYISEAVLHQQAAENSLTLSDRYRTEAQLRLAEFNRVLSSKAEFRKRIGSSNVKQPA